MTTTTAPPVEGFRLDMPEAEYHAHPTSLSVSGAKTLLKAPALYRYQQANPVHRDVFDIGSAAHALVLGVGAELEVIAADSWRSKAAQEAKAAAREAGKTPLLAADYQRVQDMADALSSHTLAMSLLSDGEPEVSAFATDEATGVLRRCRYDYLTDRIGVDLKTAASAEPGTFAAAAARYGYHQQAAWYVDVAETLGHPLDAFAFVVLEKEPPHLVSVVELDDRSLSRGRELNQRALERFRDCTETGIWPGYQTTDGYARVSIPRWAFYDDETEELSA